MFVYTAVEVDPVTCKRPRLVVVVCDAEVDVVWRERSPTVIW